MTTVQSISSKTDQDDCKHATPLDTIDVVEHNLDAVPMPESLLGFSKEELEVIERRLKRKADFIIMPIIGILYILNCTRVLTRISRMACTDASKTSIART